MADEQLAELDHFLTARWVLYTVYGGRLARASAEHNRWLLYRAELVELREELLTAAGLPRPLGEPLLHYSPGVDVRISRPRLLG